MNKLYFLFLALLITGLISAQSTISSISISPANPTENDTIYVYAELVFPSSGCELDNKSHSVSGFNIGASTQHCLGVLAAICNTTDTFKIDPLPVGTYTFHLTLSSGAAPVPCTPGIIPEDNDSISFTVASSSKIDMISQLQDIIYPNPTSDFVVIENEKLKIKYVSIYDIYGKEVLSQKSQDKDQKYTIDLSSLPQGIYIISISTDKQTIRQKVIKN